MRIALLSLVVILAAACATPPREKTPAGVLRVDVEIVRSGEDPVPGPSIVRVWMAPIIGGVRGFPSNDPIFDRRLAENESFEIRIDELESRLAAVAQAAGSDPVTYEPADTRVARVGTFAQSISEPGLSYSAGFRDPRSGHGIIVMYVDRPCRILGNTKTRDASDIRVDARLERVGLHWLVTDDSEEGVRRITAQPAGDHLLYVLQR